MKTPPILAALPLMGLLVLSPAARGADEKTTADKAKEMLDKVMEEVSKASTKTEVKARELWERTKDNLRLSKDEYIKKVQSAMATMEAEIGALAESGTAVTSRDYFKLRIESLKLHLEYCKRDLERLKETTTEEAFRVKQRGFDRTLGALGDTVTLAKDEAGL